MARGTVYEKAFRKELVTHLYRMHNITMPVVPNSTMDLSELEELHNMLHTDGYMAPPHEHPDAEAYTLGEPRLLLGDDYLQEVVDAIKGEQ